MFLVVKESSCIDRQLQMFLQLMQTNPTVLPALGSRFAIIAQELERMEKMEELQVW